MGDSFVRLTDEVRSEYAKTMAHIWTRVEELREKKARESKKTQEAIDEELEEIGRLCRVINDDGQPTDQLDLFAASALAEVAKRSACFGRYDETSCMTCGECSCPANQDGRGLRRAADCPLHGDESRHAKGDSEPTEPQIIEALARECVEEWERRGETPESVKDRNAAVKLAIAARSIAAYQRKPFAEAVKRLLSDVPTLPVGAEAEVDGNVAEAGA